jgi:hypothetical protein
MQKYQFANWLVTISIVQRSERDPLGERDCEMRRFLIYYLTRREGNDEKKAERSPHFAQKLIPSDLHFIVECL